MAWILAPARPSLSRGVLSVLHAVGQFCSEAIPLPRESLKRSFRSRPAPPIPIFISKIVL